MKTVGGYYIPSYIPKDYNASTLGFPSRDSDLGGTFELDYSINAKLYQSSADHIEIIEETYNKNYPTSKDCRYGYFDYGISYSGILPPCKIFINSSRDKIFLSETNDEVGISYISGYLIKEPVIIYFYTRPALSREETMKIIDSLKSVTTESYQFPKISFPYVSCWELSNFLCINNSPSDH